MIAALLICAVLALGITFDVISDLFDIVRSL